MHHRMVLFLDLVRLRADFSQRLTLLPRLHTWPGFAPAPNYNLTIVPSKRATISTFEFIALSPDLVGLRPDFAWQTTSWSAQAQHFAPGPPVGTPEGLILDFRGVPDGSFSSPEELPGPPRGPPDFGASETGGGFAPTPIVSLACVGGAPRHLVVPLCRASPRPRAI